MRLAKRVMAVALSAAMLVSGLYVGQTASAQTSYETTGVYVDTELVPDDKNIQVKKGDVPTITTKTNVKFTLDCNVDCTWEITDVDVQDTTKPQVSINSYGEVSVPANASTGTYTITARGKNVTNTNKTATCKIIIESTDQATGEITLDKELIEAEYAQYDTDTQKVVEVEEDGKSLTVNGRVEGLRLYTKISPEYLLNDTVAFRSNKTDAATIASNVLLTTKTKTTSDGITLLATCGTDARTQEFPLYINERAYKAEIDCKDIPTGDKNDNNNSYTVRLNEDINFQILDNEEITLNEVATNPIKWTLKYGDAKTIGSTDALTNGNGTISTELGDFVFTNGGKNINLKTPIDNKENAAYKTYMDRVKNAGSTGQDTITLAPELSYQYVGTSQPVEFSLHTVTLNFNDEVNRFSGISVDFPSAGLVKDIDYSVKKETINGKECEVYYFESGESVGNVLDLAEATKSNISGVRDFEESKDNNFVDGNKYEIRYYLQEVAGLDDIYQNSDLLSSTNTEIESTNKYVTTAGRTLTKKGIGYFRLHLEMTTGSDKAEADCIMRFVSSAESLQLRHTRNYTAEDKEYNNQAVIHIRRGEADRPSVFLGSTEISGADITIKNPFIKFEVAEVIKGKGEVATADINSEGQIKISGLRPGKVRIKATSVVDARESRDYLLYVNEEVFGLEKDQLEIDTTEAQKLGRMNARDEVSGHYTDIPLKIKVNNANSGIPEVKWSITDDAEKQFATITDDGILTTLKSTGSNTITVRATCVDDSSIYVEKKISILDVFATKILTIGEKVAPGATGVLTSAVDLAGTAKVGEKFILEPKSYEPANATSVNGGITWTSGNTAVATIDETTGMVTTLAEGEVAIEAKYSSNTSNQTTTFNLTVAGYAERVTSISAGGDVTLTRVGQTHTLVPTVLPATVSDKSVVYEVTEGKDIITVTENGVITALKPGTAKVKITSNLTPSVSTMITVTVKGEEDKGPGTPTQQPQPTAPNLPQQPQPTANNVPAKNTIVKSAGSTYVVTNASTSKGEVALKTAKKAKSVKVPDTVTVSGTKYKVTSVKANAFKGNKQLTSVTIGKNVKSIEKNAFNGCKKLTKITIKSQVLKKVGAKAFAKGAKKVTVTVPKKQAKAYKKLLKKAGISSKAKYKLK